MSGFVEVMITGDCRAFLEASSIVGILTASGCSSDTPATSETPMSLIMRGGDTLPGVYGVSPTRLLVHIAGVKLLMRDRKRFSVVAYLDRLVEFETEIEEALFGKANVDG